MTDKQGKEGDSESSQEIFDIVNAVYQSYYAPDPSLQEPIITDDKTPDMYVFFDEETAGEATDEFKMYCNGSERLRAAGSQNIDVLNWWKNKSKLYPNLSKMARDYLAIPATSTSSERLFSSGKHLISDTRNSLSSRTIQACQCLKSWEI